MTILLKNLTARVPNMQDRAALAELVCLCECIEDSTLEDVLSARQGLDARLDHDAWVIVTTGGQLVGFACLWREEDTRITTYLCVHPYYRCRGIGTLLLRMVEMRARQLTRQVASERRVVLQGLVKSTNAGAHRLFEREGYQMGHAFLRISCVLNNEDQPQDPPVGTRQFAVDIDLEQRNQPLATTSLTGQDVLCAVNLHRRYEKELRPAIREMSYTPTNLQAVGA
jgi:GNAT superfamily N-acetyltransferase